MKNKLMFTILIMIILLTGGCGTNNYLKDENNKIVQYEKTGQNLPSNILCQPNDKELYEIYSKYNDQLKIKLDDLPKCEEFKITTKNSGLWEIIFIKPLAYLILKLGTIIGNMGISLILVGLLIRIILLPFSYKMQRQSKDMQKVQSEMQKLEFKYRGRDDRESMMMKATEMRELYKKYNVSPMGGCLIAFIQLPVFLAFLQAINRVPAIFDDKLFGFNLGMTPYVGLSNGNYWYILLILLIAASTYFSFKYSMNQNKGMSNSNNPMPDMSMMTNIMVVMIVMTSFSLTTALSFYWIVTYAFIAIQTYIFKRLLNKDKNIKKNQKRIQEKLKMKKGMKYGSNN